MFADTTNGLADLNDAYRREVGQNFAKQRGIDRFFGWDSTGEEADPAVAESCRRGAPPRIRALGGSQK